jgi:NADPH:quinone reductase-like Zn-dependent oxidoreductase
MNAAVVNAFGVPPRYTSFAEPVATDGEVLVNVSAVGLHRVVKALADGSHYASSNMLPLIPGVDGVGRLEDGTRVYFGMVRPPFGTFAERAVTAPHMCLPIPEALDDVTVAAIMNPGMSSWAALLRAHFVAGESVLILGATGVAGQLAVQVAKRLGARRVVASGRNPQVLEELEQRGADAVISLTGKRGFVAPQRMGQGQVRYCVGLRVGQSGRVFARGCLAEGKRACRLANPFCPGRGERGPNDRVAGRNPAQWRT